MNIHHIKWYDPDEHTECPKCGQWTYNCYSTVCDNEDCDYVGPD